MGWYRHLTNKTKGLKRMSRDIGRILAGEQMTDILDNANSAADVAEKLEGSDVVVKVKGLEGEKKKRKKKSGE